jgi:chloramphenicol O-acetyltransferase type A
LKKPADCPSSPSSPARPADEPAPTYLDTAHWARRDAFDLFRGFAQPYFSLCVRLDVAPLKAWLAAQPRPGGFSLACHYLALRLANEQQPLRLRLAPPDKVKGASNDAMEDDPAAGIPRVRDHARVDGSTTVLRPDDSFGFAQLRWRPRFADFRACGEAAFQAVRESPPDEQAPGFTPPPPEPGDALAASGEATTMYFTTLPWVHFTAFMHARPGALPGHGPDEGTPRVVFGGVRAESSRPGAPQWMPVQLDAHHALMDGLQAGRWLQALEAALAAPQDWLG